MEMDLKIHLNNLISYQNYNPATAFPTPSGSVDPEVQKKLEHVDKMVEKVRAMIDRVLSWKESAWYEKEREGERSANVVDDAGVERGRLLRRDRH